VKSEVAIAVTESESEIEIQSRPPGSRLLSCVSHSCLLVPIL